MKYYLAGPVDFHPEERTWKDELKKMCKENTGIILFDPDSFSFGTITREVSDYIHDVNMQALNRADVLVVKWISKFKGVGTIIELYHAVQIGKPIVLITDMMETSVYLNYIGNRSNVVSDLNGAYGVMLKFENEKAKLREHHTLLRGIGGKLVDGGSVPLSSSLAGLSDELCKAEA